MGEISPLARPFWEAPLASLDAGQWEALCDGCGKCCLHKLEDEETGRIYPTNVACRDCLTLTKAKVADIEWLPQSCAYRLRAEGRPLPDWHYLVCGDRDAVHRVGESIVGWTVSEDIAGPLENHLVQRVV